MSLVGGCCQHRGLTAVVHCIYRRPHTGVEPVGQTEGVSPDGTDSSTKVDLSRRVIRLSGNSTPDGQSVTSQGAGGRPAEAIIRLLFGDVCDRAGPFLKFEKNHRAVRFLLKTAVFGFSFKTITAVISDVNINLATTTFIHLRCINLRIWCRDIAKKINMASLNHIGVGKL